MPFVTIQTVRGIMDQARKQELLDRVTDLMVEIEGRGNPDFRKMVWVKIEEQEPESWSLGGIRLTSGMIEKQSGRLHPDGSRGTANDG